MKGVALRQTATGWEFISEAALEHFLWQNLAALGLTPLRQQYRLKEEICDLLAVDQQRGLVLLELKNVEDRYLLPQITRYYDSLLEEMPFSTAVDYERPIRLIAIAPSFHRHNWIDKKHSRLEVAFMTFSIHQDHDRFALHLTQCETGQIIQLELPYQALDRASFDAQLPPPPDIFVAWLGACGPAEQSALMHTRATLLRFDPRLQETVVAQSVQTRNIQYGKGQKVCAELCFDRKAKQPVLFLWLTLPTGYNKKLVGRMRVWLQEDTAAYVGHVPAGMGKMKSLEEWLQAGVQKHQLNASFTRNSPQPVSLHSYFTRLEQLGHHSTNINDLNALLALALQHWFEKL